MIEENDQKEGRIVQKRTRGRREKATDKRTRDRGGKERRKYENEREKRGKEMRGRSGEEGDNENASNRLRTSWIMHTMPANFLATSDTHSLIHDDIMGIALSQCNAHKN